MIRRSSTNRHRKDNIFPGAISTFPSYSAIKSNTIQGSNRPEHTNTNFHPPHIHFDIGRRAGDANSKDNPKVRERR
jgi:hypothetical protein